MRTVSNTKRACVSAAKVVTGGARSGNVSSEVGSGGAAIAACMRLHCH